MAKCEEMRGGNASEQMEQIGVIGVGHEKDTTAPPLPLFVSRLPGSLGKLEATRDTNHGLAIMAVQWQFSPLYGSSASRPSTKRNADAILLMSARRGRLIK